MSNIEPLLIQLHTLRQSEHDADRLIKAAEESFKSEMGDVLKLRDEQRIAIKDLETKIRTLTLQTWIATGDVPHPGVGVRKLLKYRYVNEEVVAWLIGKLPDMPELIHFLKVDDGKLEQAIKAGTLQCEVVHPQYEPQPTIATKLGKILGNEGVDE